MGRARAVGRLAALAAVAAVGLAAPANAQPTPAGGSGGARIVGERPVGANGVELTIATPAFAAPTRVQVFLPAGYAADPARRWPVTYYLHGAQGDQTRFNAWYGDLIRSFPSILVAPDGGQFGFYSDWYNGGAGGPPMYETYDVDQLIPLIDARFRTIARRAGRALIGESMGGYGVMTLAARHPDVFASAVSMSGLVDTDYLPAVALVDGSPAGQGGAPFAIYGPRATQAVRWHGHNPTDLAGNLGGVVLRVRTAEGIPTTTIEGTDPTSAVGCAEESAVFHTSVDFHQRLLALGVRHLWHDYGAGCHSIPNFRREFTDSLPGLEWVFAHPRPAPRDFDYRSIDPHLSVWGWRVDADPARALEFLELRHAGRLGVTLVGSGITRVTTPPFFGGRTAVAVVAGARVRVVRTDRRGRLHFSVDLGPAHRNQEDTPASRAAGDGRPGYFTSRTVRFVVRRAQRRVSAPARSGARAAR